MQTAEILEDVVPLAVRPEPRIAEVSIGAWDGLTDYEIEREFPGALAGASAYDWFFRSPDGETLAGVTRRVEAWLHGLQGRTLAISHGLVGRVIRGVYLGLAERRMLTLDVPQDGCFVLAHGRAEFVSAHRSPRGS